MARQRYLDANKKFFDSREGPRKHLSSLKLKTTPQEGFTVPENHELYLPGEYPPGTVFPFHKSGLVGPQVFWEMVIVDDDWLGKGPCAVPELHVDLVLGCPSMKGQPVEKLSALQRAFLRTIRQVLRGRMVNGEEYISAVDPRILFDDFRRSLDE